MLEPCPPCANHELTRVGSGAPVVDGVPLFAPRGGISPVRSNRVKWLHWELWERIAAGEPSLRPDSPLAKSFPETQPVDSDEVRLSLLVYRDPVAKLYIWEKGKHSSSYSPGQEIKDSRLANARFDELSKAHGIDFTPVGPLILRVLDRVNIDGHL